MKLCNLASLAPYHPYHQERGNVNWPCIHLRVELMKNKIIILFSLLILIPGSSYAEMSEFETKFLSIAGESWIEETTNMAIQRYATCVQCMGTLKDMYCVAPEIFEGISPEHKNWKILEGEFNQFTGRACKPFELNKKFDFLLEIIAKHITLKDIDEAIARKDKSLLQPKLTLARKEYVKLLIEQFDSTSKKEIDFFEKKFSQLVNELK